MLAIDFLRAVFADGVLFRVKVTCVCPPTIGAEERQAEGLQQGFELEKDLIFPTAKDVCQDRSSAMINGMPQPARVAFVAVG